MGIRMKGVILKVRKGGWEWREEGCGDWKDEKKIKGKEGFWSNVTFYAQFVDDN